MGEEVTFTIADGGLRRVITEIDPISHHQQTLPPNQLMPLSEREFVVVTQDENEGSRVDFIERDGDAVRFVRMDGRLYDRVANAPG